MSDNEVEDVSFLAGPGQGVTGKRAVYEPTGSQRCKQVVCSKTRAVGIVTIFVLIVLVIALIGSFARIVETPICVANGGSDGSDASNTNASSSDGHRQAISTNGSVFPWDHIRLPPGITPIAYHIFLHPNLTTFTFNGTTNITFRVTNDSEFVVVHIKNLKVNNVSVKQTQDPAIPKSDDSGFTGTNLHVVDTMECIEYEMLYIKVQPHFIGGAFYTLSINYFANVSRQLVGFYRSSYNMNGEKRWLLTTHFQPTDARGAFPCFDEPEMKANFTLSMVRDTDHISLFNMPLKTTTPYTDENNTPGLVRDDFETSVRMSTYLVAFVVCDFKVVSRNTTKGTLVSVYTPPDQISQADFALETATSVLEYFETFFGIDYPLPKQDLIAIPDFAAGAMENWGLITYRLTTILYDPQVSSASNQQHVAIVVAHELAHQWFGNLVTMKWWNDLWLNEGFASYMEYLGVHSVKPEWKMMDQFFVDTMQTALSLDSLTSSHPVSVKVDDPTEINEIFDSISYDKGAALIQMLEGFIGQTTLQEGLKDYLKEHMFGNAETHDLWMSLSKRLKKQPDGNVIDVSKVMSTWTDQMGYPVVTLTRKGSTIQADQQRFLLNPKAITDTSEAAYGYKWEIPLTYFTDYSSTPNIKWMRRGSVTFNVNSNLHWIKANVEQKGLYRVHYDDQNWRALIQQLHTNHSVFSAADRAGLIDDAFALSRSRHLNVSVALDLSNYLDKETEYVPWVTALSNLDYIGNLLEDKASYQYYSAYMKSKLQHMVEQLGWQDSGNILDKYLRAYTLSKAIKLNHEPSVNKAKQMFGNWMHSGTNVSANLKNVVYRAGIHYSCEDEWEFVWDKYTQTQVPSEKVKLMVALAATRDGSKLLRYLDMALDENKVRKGDTVSVVTNIASTAAGQILAWRKVKQHWDVYMKRYGRGSFDMTQLIQGITSGFATQFDYDEVQSFFNTHQSGSGYRTVSQALEHIQMNSDYLAVNLNTVETWLKDKVEQLGLLPSDSNVS